SRCSMHRLYTALTGAVVLAQCQSSVRKLRMAPTSTTPSEYAAMVAAEFQALLDAAVDAIIVIDQLGQILTFNRAAEQMFGYAAAAIVGQDVSMLMGEPHRSRHHEYLGRYLATGEPHI